MSDSRTAGGLDRLPWLSDEPAPKAPAPSKAVPVKRGAIDLVGWGTAAILLIAGASFWLGTKSPAPQVSTPVPAPNSTVAIPQPRSAPAPQVRLAPQPDVAPVPAPLVRPTPAPQVHIVPPPVRRVATHESAKPTTSVPEEKATQPEAEAKAATSASAQASKPAAPAKLTPWPPRVTAGAYGRLVQIGAFGSVDQAKFGWRYMVRAYPAVAHLPAVVRPDRNSKGRVFYRFRIGTTSQAHSEVLCQRMQRIHLSCAVMGLPWKAKIER
jgi:outer membrane biosynthesis protein TonB